jgi:hypothetical protein
MVFSSEEKAKTMQNNSSMRPSGAQLILSEVPSYATDDQIVNLFVREKGYLSMERGSSTNNSSSNNNTSSSSNSSTVTIHFASLPDAQHVLMNPPKDLFPSSTLTLADSTTHAVIQPVSSGSSSSSGTVVRPNSSDVHALLNGILPRSASKLFSEQMDHLFMNVVRGMQPPDATSVLSVTRIPQDVTPRELRQVFCSLPGYEKVTKVSKGDAPVEFHVRFRHKGYAYFALLMRLNYVVDRSVIAEPMDVDFVAHADDE